jgi:hypothetical protein
MGNRGGDGVPVGRQKHEKEEVMASYRGGDQGVARGT